MSLALFRLRQRNKSPRQKTQEGDGHICTISLLGTSQIDFCVLLCILLRAISDRPTAHPAKSKVQIIQLPAHPAWGRNPWVKGGVQYGTAVI